MRIELLMFMTGFLPDSPVHVYISKMLISEHLFPKLLAAFVIRIKHLFNVLFSFVEKYGMFRGLFAETLRLKISVTSIGTETALWQISV